MADLRVRSRSRAPTARQIEAAVKRFLPRVTGTGYPGRLPLHGKLDRLKRPYRRSMRQKVDGDCEHNRQHTAQPYPTQDRPGRILLAFVGMCVLISGTPELEEERWLPRRAMMPSRT